MKQSSDRADRAVALFQQGFSCSQAVLSIYGAELGLDRDTALKLAAGFGGGMGRMAETCGALTGAYMVLGLRHGAVAADDRAAKENTHRKVRELTAKFRARNGSTLCKTLLHCDISTDSGFAEAKQKNLITTVCPKLVRDAAEILEEVL